LVSSLFRDVQDPVIVHGEITSVDTVTRRNEKSVFANGWNLERKQISYYRDRLVQALGH
jgi:hypothetical protein